MHVQSHCSDKPFILARSRLLVAVASVICRTFSRAHLRHEHTTPNLCIREVYSRLHLVVVVDSSSATHFCLALKCLITFCLTLTN